MSERALTTGHYVGSVLAACTGGALLAAHPERYEHWALTLGVEQARVRFVDWLSRASSCFHKLESGAWTGSNVLHELETPLRALLTQVVGWAGDLPVPIATTAAAEAALPFLGIASVDPKGFDACEAPTIPTPAQASSALESLDQDLVDERSEVKLLLEGLVHNLNLTSAMVSYRSGEAIACAGCVVGPTSPAAHSAGDTTPLVADLLGTSDLFFTLGVDGEFSAVRMTGAHAMLIASSPSRHTVTQLREPSLGFMMNNLLESFRFRVDRISAPPALTADEAPSGPIR